MYSCPISSAFDFIPFKIWRLLLWLLWELLVELWELWVLLIKLWVLTVKLLILIIELLEFWFELLMFWLELYIFLGFSVEILIKWIIEVIKWLWTFNYA